MIDFVIYVMLIEIYKIFCLVVKCSGIDFLVIFFFLEVYLGCINGNLKFSFFFGCCFFKVRL